VVYYTNAPFSLFLDTSKVFDRTKRSLLFKKINKNNAPIQRRRISVLEPDHASDVKHFSIRSLYCLQPVMLDKWELKSMSIRCSHLWTLSSSGSTSNNLLVNSNMFHAYFLCVFDIHAFVIERYQVFRQWVSSTIAIIIPFPARDVFTKLSLEKALPGDFFSSGFHHTAIWTYVRFPIKTDIQYCLQLHFKFNFSYSEVNCKWYGNGFLAVIC